MTLLSLLRLYAEQGLLLIIGWCLLRGAWEWAQRGSRVRPESWRRLASSLIVLALVLPILTRCIDLPEWRRGIGPASSTMPSAAPTTTPAHAMTPWPVYRVTLPAETSRWAEVGAALLAAGAAVRLTAMIVRRRRLRVYLATLPVVRRIGRVVLAASDEAPVPYALRAGGRAWVVLPTDLLAEARLRVVVAHEIQHHRQGDLLTLQRLEVLQALFSWNPAAWAWRRFHEELQELCCDDALLARGRVAPAAYAAVLVQAARSGRRVRFVPRAAASAVSGGILARRITMMMEREGRRGHSWSHVWAAAACVAALAGGAVLARAAQVERALTTAEVETLAARLGESGVKVAVSPVLVEEVNNWVGSAKGRAFLREAQVRLERDRVRVTATLERHHVPAALAAVAVVESGFRSLEARPGLQGAGTWQFIPTTARRFGLRVGDDRDDRLDLERETDAAARYLGMNYLLFQDWPLAIAAYNQGEGAVLKAIDDASSRDAWELVRSGRLGRYPATVVAAALILEDADALLAQ